MKITIKKSFAVIMALVMCVSVLFGMNLSVFAEDTNPVTYVKDGSYVYNWGERGTTATFLSPMASTFYGDKNISLDALLALDGSPNTSSVPDSELYDALYNLMATNTYTTYDATRDLFKYTDCQNSGGAISSFYSGKSIGPAWDQGSTWNREHVWPNSKSNGGSESNTRRETDIMMLRPTQKDENGDRSNKAYGASSSYYNPNSESGGVYDLRGDVARIVLYVYVRWGGDATYHDGALNFMWGSSGVIESKDVLIEWMEADPVDTWEMGRNDSTEAILGTRNVFVDYPELAFALFDANIPDPNSYTTPSGGESIPGTNGTGVTSTTQATVTYSELGVKNTVSATKGQSITISAPKTALKDGYTFEGWVTTSISGETTSEPASVYQTGESYTVNENVTFYALYSRKEETGGGEVTSSNDFILYSGALTEGDYLIVYDGAAMNTTVTSSRLQYSSVTISENTISNPDTSIIWHISPNGDYWNIYNAAASKYAASTGAKNKAQLLTSKDDDKSLWTVEGTNEYEFINKKNAAAGVNKNLRRNGTFGFACYATSTGGALSLYKRQTTTGGGSTTYYFTSDGSEPLYQIQVVSSHTSRGTATLTNNTIETKVTAGNKISGYSIDPVGAATVTNNGDGTFTVSDVTADVTITINFEALPKYTATFTGNTENATIEKYEGGEITLPQYDGEVPASSIFTGWLANGETETRLAGSKYTITADITFTAQFVTTDIDDSQATESTITFDSTDKRTAYSSEQQIWQENGIIVTNNKASSQTAVGNYANPARFYKNSELIVSLASPSSKITKIVFNANTATYATTLANTIGENDNYVVSTNSKAVTITFIQEAVYSLELILSVGQVQLDSINVYTIASSGDDIPTHTVKFVENGKVISSLSAQLGSQITLPSKSSIVTEELVGWLADGQTEALAPGSTYTIIGDVTFTAKYKVAESGGSGEATSYYEKVTSTADITDGKYLIVYEAGNVAFNAGLTSFDAVNNTIAITKDNGRIPVTANTTNAQFTINVTDKTIKSSLGYYIGRTSSSNGLNASTSTKYTNTISIDSSGNVIIKCQAGTYLRFNSASNQNRFRYYGSGQQAIQLYKLIEVGGGSAEATGEIKGAQVSVGSDLSLNYYVNLTNISDISNVVMKFTLDGKTTEVACSSKNIIDGKYVFTLYNIPPQTMTTTITAVLLYGDTELATLDYTIQQNAKNLLATYPNDTKLKQFISDMLNYGAKAQIYADYNTDNLATDGLDLSPSTITPEESYADLSESAGSSSFRSATVWFDAVNCLIVKVKNRTDDTKVKVTVNGETIELVYDETIDGYKTPAILATDFGTSYTFTLYEGDTDVQTLVYSVNTYAYSKYTTGKTQSMKDLALALYRYGVSAKAYYDSIS